MGVKGVKADALDFYERMQLDIGSFEGRFGESGSQLDKLSKRLVGFEAETDKRTSGFKRDVIKTRQSGTAITSEVREGLKLKHGLTSTNLLKKVRRALGSMTSINPELVGDLTEKLLSGNYTDKEIAAAWRTFHETIEQMQNDGYKVGHHAISLSLMKEPLSTLPRNTQNQVLNILEQKYGYQFAETGMKYVSPVAHESAQIGKTRKPGSYKTGLRLDYQEALGGVASVDEVNPNLRSILEPRMAHAERFGGNKGFGAQATEAIKGETDAAKIASKLQPFIEVELAGTRQGLETTKTIFNTGFKDGKLVPKNWEVGGKLEKALDKSEIIQPNKLLINPENAKTKVKPNVLSAKFAGGLRRSEALGNVVVGASTGNIPQTVAGGAGVILSDEKVQARIAKELAKLTAKRAGKTAAKFVPGLDIGISAGEAYGYAATGNYGQAAIAGLSGAVGWIPGVGDAASAGLDAINFGKDTQKIYDKYKKAGLTNVDLELDDIADFDGKPSRRLLKNIKWQYTHETHYNPLGGDLNGHTTKKN